MEDNFKEWGIIELMGHTRLIGAVSEAPIGGGSLIRIDVPTVDNIQGFTKMVGVKSIYAITITDEETALSMIKATKPVPISRFSARQLLESGDDDESF